MPIGIHLLLLGLLSMRIVRNVVPYTLNMYKTKSEMFGEEDRYCIYHSTLNHILISNFPLHNLYMYCIRNGDSYTDDYYQSPDTTDSSKSFNDLRKLGITSQQMLSWSTPIDIVEDYQSYLINDTNTTSQLASQRFYNCSWPFFGPLCQFAFSIAHNSFEDLIDKAFQYPLNDEEEQLKNPVPCYTLIQCNYIYPFPLCLDWREVCDGTVHCLNQAQDEQNCFALEMNECTNDDEYRCHNGAQCIPRVFFHDDALHPDCLDRSDESLDYSPYCYVNSSIACEEHTCRPGRNTLVCGDGSCDEFQDCSNGRTEQLDNILYGNSTHLPDNDICWIVISCLTKISIGDKCDDILWNQIDLIMQYYCPSLFRYPFHSVALGHISFYYSNTQSYLKRLYKIALPMFVCYNKILCPDFETSTSFLRSVRISSDNKTSIRCHYQSDLPLSNEDRNHTWHYFQRAILKFYTTSCLTYGQLHMNITKNMCHSHSQLYQCIHSNKCISKHRILDAIRDCPFGDDEEYEQSCSLSKHKYRFQCIYNKTTKCISPILFDHEEYDCLTPVNKIHGVPDVESTSANLPISFQTLCDGFQDRNPLITGDKQLETDETHCDNNIWQCNNTYTHCDGY